MKGIDKKLIIFSTKKRFNDRNVDDMQSGDIDVNTLKTHYHLGQVSTSLTGQLLVPPISILLQARSLRLVEKKLLRCYMMNYDLNRMFSLFEVHIKA